MAPARQLAGLARRAPRPRRGRSATNRGRRRCPSRSDRRRRPTAQSRPRSVARSWNGPDAAWSTDDRVEQLDDEVRGQSAPGVRRAEVDVVDLHLAPPRRHDGHRRPGGAAGQAVDVARPVLVLQRLHGVRERGRRGEQPLPQLAGLGLRRAPRSRRRAARRTRTSPPARSCATRPPRRRVRTRSGRGGPPRGRGSTPAAATGPRARRPSGRRPCGSGPARRPRGRRGRRGPTQGRAHSGQAHSRRARSGQGRWSWPHPNPVAGPKPAPRWTAGEVVGGRGYVRAAAVCVAACRIR